MVMTNKYAAEKNVDEALESLHEAMRLLIESKNQHALVTLRESAEWVESAIRETVRLLRAEGKSWEEIGGSLGMTKQSAWGKYSGRLDK